MNETTPPSRNRADHMANERTFLAWIRTSIGIMAFGFVVEKFALFMKQIAVFFAKETITLPPIQQGYSSLAGIILVVFGILIGFFAFLKFRKIEKQIENNSYQSSTKLATTLAVVVIVSGIFLAIYLIRS
jgi:uncharacterized membrane protein YidH (DUF202 family)